MIQRIRLRSIIVCKLVPFVGIFLMLKGTMDAQTPAAEQLTILQVVQEARTNNLSLQALKYESAAAHGDIVTAGLRPNPSITINGDLLPSDGITPKDKSYGVSFAVPFELGSKRQARVDAAVLLRDVTDLKYNDAIRQTIFSVKSAYIDLASAYLKAGVSNTNLRLLDSLVSLNRIRVAGKDIAAVDLVRSEVEREKFSLDVLAAEQSYKTASTSLSAILGRKTSSTLILPDTSAVVNVAALINNSLPSVDSLFAIAERERTDILVLKRSEDATNAQLALANSLSAIDLTVSLDVLRQQSVTFYGASFNFPLPIFDRHQGDIEKAEAYHSESVAATTVATNQLRADLQAAMNDVLTKREALRRLVTNILSKSEQVRQSVEYAYRRGGTSLIDYLDATRTENELRQFYVDALGAFAKSLITLDYITGKEIFYVL